ncbi:MAG: hypothetical protein ABI347_05760 [Nitrososphaera sp.]|jgi:hypothetical protein
MMHRPKPVRDHYTESLQINSENMARQLVEASVPQEETTRILGEISLLYMAEVDKIVAECERDMMALEKVPAPLKLFVECIAQVNSGSPPAAARQLLEKYVAAWEDWM